MGGERISWLRTNDSELVQSIERSRTELNRHMGTTAVTRPVTHPIHCPARDFNIQSTARISGICYCAHPSPDSGHYDAHQPPSCHVDSHWRTPDHARSNTNEKDEFRILAAMGAIPARGRITTTFAALPTYENCAPCENSELHTSSIIRRRGRTTAPHTTVRANRFRDYGHLGNRISGVF